MSGWGGTGVERVRVTWGNRGARGATEYQCKMVRPAPFSGEQLEAANCGRAPPGEGWRGLGVQMLGAWQRNVLGCRPWQHVSVTFEEG